MTDKENLRVALLEVKRLGKEIKDLKKKIRNLKDGLSDGNWENVTSIDSEGNTVIHEMGQ